jgi:hypothetical protein
MSRPVSLSLASVLSLAGSVQLAHANDSRIDPGAMARRSEFSLAFPRAARALDLDGSAGLGDKARLPQEYASAMTFYRVALAQGYTQTPILDASRSYDEQLPEPLNWTWVAGNGDVVARISRGVFRLSFAGNGSNLFQEVDCKLVTWPGGDTEAPMTCSDGSQRKMEIPGDGVLYVDDVEYKRVFVSDQTTLPPEEVIDVDAVTAAAIAGEPLPLHATLTLPTKAPVPQLRPEAAPAQPAPQEPIAAAQ